MAAKRLKLSIHCQRLAISLIAGIEGMVAFMLFYEGGGGHRFLQFS
jgi:hypothetical protein